MSREYEKVRASGARGAVGDLARRWGVGRNYFSQFAEQFRETVSYERAPRTCQRYTLTPEVKGFIERIAERKNHDFTYEEMAALLKNKHGVQVSASSIRRLVKEDHQWMTYRNTDKPTLSPQQMQRRLEWASENRSNPWNFWVDIDEKWFHGRNQKRIRKKLKSKPRKFSFVASRSNIAEKSMFLVAVARPRPEIGFDGKIGCWRVTEKKVALRRSKNHAKNDTYEVDCTMTAERFRSMMKNVVRAIRKKLPTAELVTVQMDGAKPHTGCGNLNYFNAAYSKGVKGRGRIQFIVQPPNSPDLNVCDLAVFPSMSSRLSKLKTTARRIPARTLTIWREYEPKVLNDAFNYKGFILGKIIEAGGNNDFVLPHSRVHSPIFSEV